MNRLLNLLPLALCLVVLTLGGSTLNAQDAGTGISVRVPPQSMGLKGVVRPGYWTPLRFEVENRTGSSPEVACQWVLNDYDGDRVLATRRVTITANRTQRFWIYAPLPVTATQNTQWSLLITEVDTGRQLAVTQFTMPEPPLPVRPHQDRFRSATVAMTTANLMGMSRYQAARTQHEDMYVLTGMDPSELPDRWYGLSGLSAFVWTHDALNSDPSSPAPAVQDAIRGWIERGGHLVVVLPSSGNPWEASAMEDLLPPVRVNTLNDQPVPSWVFETAPRRRVGTVTTRPMEPVNDAVTVILRDFEDRPLVVAWPVGMGRVTMIGVDLTSGRLRAAGMPNGSELWGPVMGWRSPAWSQDKIASEEKDNRIAKFRGVDSVDDPLIKEQTAMTGRAASALLLALLLFAVYWLVAGPIGFAYLRSRDMSRHSWLVFSIVVLVTSGIAWSGAVLLRPTDRQIQHLSFVDMNSRTGRIVTRSFLEVFLPRHGNARISFDDAEGRYTGNTIGVMGFESSQSLGSFAGSLEYALPASDPDQLNLPFRSTSKPLTLCYAGDAISTDPSVTQDWRLPHGTAKLKIIRKGPGQRPAFEVTGQFSHDLPGTLENAAVFLCPGEGMPPLHKWIPQFKPGAENALDLEGQIYEPAYFESYDSANRLTRYHGYLSRITPGINRPNPRSGRDTSTLLERLTFFETLSPPDFAASAGIRQVPYLERMLGRDVDISHQLQLRQVMLIGHLRDAELPAPLRVDGQRIDSTGWVMIRCRYPLDVEIEDAEPAEPEAEDVDDAEAAAAADRAAPMPG